MFYEITSFGGSLRLVNREAVMESENSSISITGYASKTCSIIEHIPYNLIFTIKFNNSSTLTTIISCDYLNFSVVNEYVGDITMPIQVIMYNQCCSRQISQSDCSILIKLN
jgi:hypothetical protein